MSSLTPSNATPHDPAPSWNGGGSHEPLQKHKQKHKQKQEQKPHESSKRTNPMHTMAAGCLAGMSGTIVGYPLESLKVWMQTNTLGKNKHLGTQTKGSSSKVLVPNNDTNNNSANQKNGGKSRNSRRDIILKSSKTKTSSGLGARRSCSNSTTTATATTTTTTMQQRATGAAARIVAAKPATTIARTVRALYSGVTGPLVTVGMVQSVNFSAYDATRRFLYGRQQQLRACAGAGECAGSTYGHQDYRTHDSLANVAMAGSVGGMTTAVLTAPLLMMKINQQISGNSFRRAFREVFVVESSGGQSRFKPLRPYGAPFLPHIVSESVGRAIYVTVYEGLKRALLASKRGAGDGDSDNYSDNDPSSAIDPASLSLSLRERMACAAVSGITCWGAFFPLDVLRNRMYHLASRQPKAMVTNPRPLSVLGTIRTIRKERAFYRGYSVTLLRAGPVAAAVLPVYDLTVEWLASSS